MSQQHGESGYEETYLNIYEESRPPRVNPTTSPPHANKEETAVKNEQSSKPYQLVWIFVACGLFCLFGIINMALLGVVLIRQTKVEETNLPESCLELRQRGEEKSGIHKIQQSQEKLPTEIFCDMDTDGGGWSLVASIQEKDIKAKCSLDDRWSGYIADSSYSGPSAWENEMTFGSVQNSVFDDYKSSAYYRMKASNVMVWHAPSGISINLARNESKLRYRTTNSFLRQYGGNMRNLYNQHFPLTASITNSDNTGTYLKAIIRSLRGIKFTPGWYDYVIDKGSFQVQDTAMYQSFGNRVIFDSDRTRSQSIEYGHEYRNMWGSETFAFSSGETTPFTFLVAVMNDIGKTNRYDIWVRSYRSQSNIVNEFENTLTLGNFSLHYHAIQFYELDESLHTECRLYFYISNEKEWMSIPPTTFYHSYKRIKGSSNTVEYSIDGRPSRVLFGYMLLSRRSGLNYNATELDEIAGLILRRVSGYPNVMDEWRTEKSLVVPVTFDRGSESTVTKSTPPNMRKFIEPGYLQFRAANYTGYYNAICPGVSVKSISPEYVCIGGLSGDITEQGTCGDFAGWGGVDGERVHPTTSTGYAHSSSDLASTLLIFYR